MTTKIRELVEADAGILRALRLEALLDTPDAFLSTHAEEEPNSVEWFATRLREAVDDDARFTLGAFRDGQLIGMVGTFRGAHIKSLHKVFVWGMYVTPTARGLGVARSMLAKVLSRLRGVEGVEQVHLSVVPTLTAACALYEKLGFDVVSVEERAMKDGDRYIDEQHRMHMITPSVS